jgi:hypothetical protein
VTIRARAQARGAILVGLANTLPRLSRPLVALCAVLLAATAIAQTPHSRPSRSPASRPASRPTSQASSQPAADAGATTKPTTQPAEKKDRYLAVINAQVHTVTGPVLDQATVLCKNGVIAAIGEDVQPPADCEIIDAHGFCVYPGLVACAASGIHGNDPQDETNVYGINMLIALAGGITTATAGNHAAKLTFGSVDDILVKSNLHIPIAYSSRDPLGRAQLRADLERVRKYLREAAKHEREKATNPEAKPPDKDWLKERFENYRKLLQHEAVAVTSAGSAQELRDVSSLAESYGFELVIRGAYEGWVAARELGHAGVRAVIVPREDRSPNEESNQPTGSSIENAHILRDHGVIVGVVSQTAGIGLSGLAGHDLLHLNMEAAFAVRGGMSNDDAVRAITIDAARILGVDDRVGSLEVGKDADLVVCDGDILHYMTQVHYTIVNGRIAYTKAKESLLAHIRPQGKPEVPAFDDHWPRRLEWPGE